MTAGTAKTDGHGAEPGVPEDDGVRASSGTSVEAKSSREENPPPSPLAASREESQEETGQPRQKFWKGAVQGFAETTWLSPKSAVAMTGVVLGLLTILGALIASSSAVFSKMVLATYGAHAHQYHGTYIAVLAVFTATIGLATAISIFAHRGTGAGIASMGGMNRSRFVEGSSAAERRLDVATYALIGLFFALCAITSFLMV